MSSTKTVIHTRSHSTPEDHDRPGLDEILDQAKAKNRNNRKAKGTGKKTTGGKGASIGSRDQAIALGVIAWNNMFQERLVKLPVTDFMDQLEEALNKEQLDK